MSNFLAEARHLPPGRHRAGDRHLNFYETRDNLSVGTLVLSVLSVGSASEGAEETASTGADEMSVVGVPIDVFSASGEPWEEQPFMVSRRHSVAVPAATQ